MEIFNQTPWIVTIFGLIFLIFILYKLVLWARSGSKGAILLAAMLSFLTPDPIFEKNYRIVQESKKLQEENEDESGDPPTT